MAHDPISQNPQYNGCTLSSNFATKSSNSYGELMEIHVTYNP